MRPGMGRTSYSFKLHDVSEQARSFINEVWNADCTIALDSSSGMIPSNLVGKVVGSRPFAKSDTWFSVGPACLLLF